MAYPTPAEIDAAIPADGEPSRALTNATIKSIVENSVEADGFSRISIVAEYPATEDPDTLYILVPA